MVRKKKRGVIVASSFLVGTLIIGGTTLGTISHNHKVRVNEARVEVQDIQTSLKSMYSEVASFTNKDGYIKSGFTLDNLQPIEKELNSYKDSYTDFGIKKDELKNEIKVVKIDKKAVTTEMDKLETKYEVQEAVNKLFSKGVLDGDKVTESPVKDNLTSKEVEEVEQLVLSKVDSPSKWSESINKVVKLASTQVKQQEVATKEVGKLISNDKVKDGVSRDSYNKAKEEVNKVKNEKVKTDLNTSLDKVLKVIKADEKKAEEQAKALEKMKSDAEAKSQSQTQQSSSGVTSSNGQATYSSNGGSTSTSKSSNSNSSSSSNSSSTSKSSSSSSNTSKSTGSSNTSKPTGSSNTSKSSNSGSTTGKSSSSSNKSSGSSQSSTPPKSGTVSNVKKTGEGVIKNHANPNSTEGNSTYERGTFEWNPGN